MILQKNYLITILDDDSNEISIPEIVSDDNVCEYLNIVIELLSDNENIEKLSISVDITLEIEWNIENRNDVEYFLNHLMNILKLMVFMVVKNEQEYVRYVELK